MGVPPTNAPFNVNGVVRTVVVRHQPIIRQEPSLACALLYACAAWRPHCPYPFSIATAYSGIGVCPFLHTNTARARRPAHATQKRKNDASPCQFHTDTCVYHSAVCSPHWRLRQVLAAPLPAWPRTLFLRPQDPGSYPPEPVDTVALSGAQPQRGGRKRKM